MTVSKSCLICGWWMSAREGGRRYVCSLGLLVLTWAIESCVYRCVSRGLIRPVNYSMNTYSIARAKFFTYCEIIMQLYDYCCCEILDSEPFEIILALLNFLLYGLYRAYYDRYRAR